ncbi:MAG: hypothetical protein KGL35_11875 [Bradyrhizobium sp.]|nr:hypothetical protein [Bradyrhizobium sp.]
MKASGYDRVTNDWYIEPRWCVDALLDREAFTGTVIDPCCGAGNIIRACQDRGMHARGADIMDRGSGFETADWRSWIAAPNVITNPPYGQINEFIERMVEIAARKVCILARLALLEGAERGKLFDRTPLARVWVSRRRISMPPGGSDIKASGGSIAYAWFVWERGYIGAPALGWFS